METGEVEVDDSGREKEPFRSGRVVQDVQRIVCHSMELFFRADNSDRTRAKRTLAEAGKGKF